MKSAIRAPMPTITIQLLKPAKQQIITFPAELLRQVEGEIVVRAVWERPSLDLGYTTFEAGAEFIEYYYTDHWYTIYAIHNTYGMLQGWYCNVTRPAHFDGMLLTSEDLEIDLFVSADRQTLLTLDMDEFEARNFQHVDPATYHAALEALTELKTMAQAGEHPFNPSSYKAPAY